MYDHCTSSYKINTLPPPIPQTSPRSRCVIISQAIKPHFLMYANKNAICNKSSPQSHITTSGSIYVEIQAQAIMKSQSEIFLRFTISQKTVSCSIFVQPPFTPSPKTWCVYDMRKCYHGQTICFTQGHIYYFLLHI